MRSNTARLAAGLAVIALAVVGFVALQGDDENDEAPPQQTAERPADGSGDQNDGGPAEPPPAPPVPTIRIRGDALVGGAETIDVSTGETVRFRVVADEAWDLHIHGYEIERTVQPGEPLQISFPAEIEGAFEAEVHGASAEFPIAEINVSPS